MLVATVLVAVAAAGCVTTTNDPDAGNGDADGATFRTEPRYGMDWESVDLPDKVEPGTEKTWHLRAVNKGAPGENEFTYRDGCGEPWQITLTGPDGDEVDWDGDVGTCDGFSEETFVGGDTKAFQWTWNGMEWDGASFVDAAPGRYTLTVGFEAMHAGVHPSEARAIVTFLVA